MCVCIYSMCSPSDWSNASFNPTDCHISKKLYNFKYYLLLVYHKSCKAVMRDVCPASRAHGQWLMREQRVVYIHLMNDFFSGK